MTYQCFAEGCPANHVSKHEVCTVSSNHRPFQGRVVDWMMETFSMEVCRNTTERNHRFLEEALELVQALGCSAAEAHMLVDYTFGRPVGDPEQEVGGALVTLAALCSAADISMVELGERELARCWQNIDRIRTKQAGKPRHSPLPGPTPVETTEQPLPQSDRNTILDAMHYPREYLARWKGAGNSANAQHTLDRLQRMLERTIERAPEEPKSPLKLAPCNCPFLSPVTSLITNPTCPVHGAAPEKATERPCSKCRAVNLHDLDNCANCGSPLKASEDTNCHICGKLWRSQHTDQERADCSAAL